MTIRIPLPSACARKTGRFPGGARLAALASLVLLAVAPARPAGATGFVPGASTDLAVGNGPRSVVVADLNADGIPDMVVGNEGGTGISVLMGLGGGAFAAHVDYATGAVPGQVVVADLDGDGKLDVAVGQYDLNTIVVLRGTGTGTFTTGVTLDTPPHPEGLCAVDLDMDGRLDLATCGYYSTTTGVASVFLNTTTAGVLGFAARADYACGGWPNSIQGGNVGEYGWPALVTANYTGASVSILHNDGTGHFTSREDLPTPPHTYMAAVGDLFGWSDREQIVTANADSASVTLWFHDPSLGSWIRRDFPAASRPTYVQIADADGDGVPDVVASDYVANVISVFKTDAANAGLHPRVDVPTSANPYSVAVANFDGDLKPDLVSASRTGSSVRVIRGLPGAGWALGDTIPSFSAANQNGDVLHFTGTGGNRWTMLDLCSVWCGPCNEMGRHTQATYLTLAGASGLRFEYVTMLNDGPSIGIASTQANALNWAKHYQITRPVLHSGGVQGGGVQGIALQSDLWATPTLRLVGPDGVIHWMNLGAVDESTLVRVVANCAGIPVPPILLLPGANLVSGVETITYGAEVASSPRDTAGYGFTFPFVLEPGSFGENFTSDFGMFRDAAAGTEQWSVDLTYWELPDANKMALPTANAWQFTISNMVLDPTTRTLPPGTVATVAVTDTFGVQQVLPATVPVTWNGSTLTLGAVTPAMLAGLPPLRSLQFSLTMTIDPVTGVPARVPAPAFALRAPWPNPVTGTTHLAWSQTRAAATSVVVYDVGGRRVRTLADGVLAPGAHDATWDLADASGRRAGAGLYFVRLSVAGEGTRTARVTVLD